MAFKYKSFPRMPQKWMNYNRKKKKLICHDSKKMFPTGYTEISIFWLDYFCFKFVARLKFMYTNVPWNLCFLQVVLYFQYFIYYITYIINTL